MLYVSLVFSYFLIYAFLGWVYEFLYNLFVLRRLRWRGFLTLPILPIYGFSAIGIVLMVEPYVHNPFFVFAASALVVSVIEYATSLALERLFRVTLWDYTSWPYDLQGRISLLSSLGFGALGLLLVYVLQPLTASMVASGDPYVIMVISFALGAVVLIDFASSVTHLARLRIEIDRLTGTLDDVQRYLGDRIDSLVRANKKARAGFVRWQRYNLRQLRRSFPGITLFPRGK